MQIGKSSQCEIATCKRAARSDSTRSMYSTMTTQRRVSTMSACLDKQAEATDDEEEELVASALSHG